MLKGTEEELWKAAEDDPLLEEWNKVGARLLGLFLALVFREDEHGFWLWKPKMLDQ